MAVKSSTRRTSTTGSKRAAQKRSAEQALRKRIIQLCLEMNATGINQGTSGNVSAVHDGHMLITPSGIPYDKMKPSQIAKMELADESDAWQGPCKPSSEWHFHRAILRSNPAFEAVIHTHSTFATVLSMSATVIPACHYMIAAFGGKDIRCADYATYGTPELSANIVTAMEDRSACLMANHGMVVAGADLDKAMWAAVELETLSKQYYHAAAAGDVDILSDAEIEIVMERFKGYALNAQRSVTRSR